MKKPPIPQNEIERLSALYEYGLLDTVPESDYDNITQIASEICQVPISLISLIDSNRQYFKSRIGLAIPETSRDLSFCSHAINKPDEIMIITDSSKDERFFDNPLVTGDPHVVFYAGIPLVNTQGMALGTLCVIDNKPRNLTDEQKETLQALARQIVSHFELRKKNIELDRQKAELEILNKELERFAYVAAHDLKSPCNNLITLSDLIKTNYEGKLDNDDEWMLDALGTASGTLAGLVDGILHHTKAVNATDEKKEKFTFGDVVNELKRILTIPPNFSLVCHNTELKIYAHKHVLLQILLNLCVNAIKYNDKPSGEVQLNASDDGNEYSFTVTDNGPGIREQDQEKIFELFTALGADRDGRRGHGIGLSTVKRLVEKYDGVIGLSSVLGSGSKFYFTIKK